MTSIQFRVGKKWQMEEDVAVRMSLIVRGALTFHPFQKQGSTGCWQLDHGNDWFLFCVDAHDGLYELSYRYGDNKSPDNFVKSMVPFLEFAFR